MTESQYHQSERARRRRAGWRFGITFTGITLAGAIVSRLGLLDTVSWLRIEASGPLTVEWLLQRIVAAMVAGLITGALFYKTARFPALRDRSSSG